VAYFYFDFNDTAKQRQDKLIRSLVMQLAMENLEGLKKLEQLYSNCQYGQRQPTEDALVAILTELIASRDHTYIVLDALDECLSRDELMALIQEMVDWRLESLHLLATSRKEKDIEDTLEPLVTGEVCIQSALVDADIQIYIRGQLQHDPKLKNWSLSAQAEIEQALMKGANGMFVAYPPLFQGRADNFMKVSLGCLSISINPKMSQAGRSSEDPQCSPQNSRRDICTHTAQHRGRLSQRCSPSSSMALLCGPASTS